MKRAAVVGLVLGMGLIVGASFAGGGPFGPPGPPPPPNPVLGPAGPALMRLSLAPEQKEKIHAIVDDALQGGMGDLLKSFADARHAVETSVWDPASTEQQSENALRQLEAAGHRLIQARRAVARDVMKTLDATQQAELLQLLAEPPPPPPPPGMRPPSW